jgi:L-erythro-3,5-diaminohexanoate dehydrogenase
MTGKAGGTATTSPSGPSPSGQPAVTESPLGLHRVIEPPGFLPQAAWRLEPYRPGTAIAAGEVLVRVDRLNLDAASHRQIRESHAGDPDKIRAAVLEIITTRGKMQNPVTGSGGMLTGTVEQVGPRSPLGLHPGQRIATLISLTLTPLTITDSLARWDTRSEQVPCDGYAILFARSIAAPLPDDLPIPLSLAVLDVCGAPALTQRVVKAAQATASATDEVREVGGERAGGKVQPSGDAGPVVLIIGAAGKSGSLSAAAARQAGAAKIIGVVPTESEAALLRDPAGEDAGAEAVATGVRSRQTSQPQRPESPLVDEIVIADARDPVGLADKVQAAGGPANVTVVCVDVPGCEGGAILSTAQGGTVIFFSMATSFSSAALTAEGLAADVTMLVGNGYVPGHAELALGLVRSVPGLRALFERRVGAEGAEGSRP